MSIYIVRGKVGAHRAPSWREQFIDWFCYHWKGPA